MLMPLINPEDTRQARVLQGSTRTFLAQDARFTVVSTPHGWMSHTNYQEHMGLGIEKGRQGTGPFFQPGIYTPSLDGSTSVQGRKHDPGKGM